jgi:uncharacterized membrane protein
METNSQRNTASGEPLVAFSGPHHQAAAKGVAWWGEGWRLLVAAPVQWLAVTIVFVVIMVCAAFVPVLGGIAESVLSPVFAGGLMIGCRALSRGGKLEVGHLFAAFRPPHLAPLLVLGAISFAVGLLFMLAVMVPLASAFSVETVSAWMNGDVYQGISPSALFSLGIGYIVLIPIVVVAVLLLAMASWFAPALIVGNGLPVLAAMKASLVAGFDNLGAFLLYGLIFIGLAIAASIPFGLGWLVVLPMVAASTYCAWRDIFTAEGST